MVEVEVVVLVLVTAATKPRQRHTMGRRRPEKK
jgi:hypothetical protein